jgi:lipid-binding SYLF domain-containing protein
MLTQRIGGGGVALWAYKSSDAVTSVVGSSYFSNGAALGMKVGDVVMVLNTSSSLSSLTNVSAVTAGAGATVTAVFTSST